MNHVAFWNDKHAKSDSYWLTGSKPENIITQHNLTEEMKRCNRFLDIGVGLGDMTRFAKSQKKHVIATDISNVALGKLNNIADETVNIVNVSSIKPVDLAICHLVFQHCDNETITDIINNVPLTDNGFFSFQFACLRKGESPNTTVKKHLENKTHFLRDMDEMKTIISSTNKEFVSQGKPIDYYHDENLRWYFCKVKNKNIVSI